MLLPLITDTCTLGGILLSLGVFLLALAKPDLWRSTPLPALAKFTLGVYVSHLLIIYTLTGVRWRLENLFPFLSPLWPFLFPFAVYLAAVLFTFILWKMPIIQYLVLRSPHSPAPETPRPFNVPSVWEIYGQSVSPIATSMLPNVR